MGCIIDYKSLQKYNNPPVENYGISNAISIYTVVVVFQATTVSKQPTNSMQFKRFKGKSQEYYKNKKIKNVEEVQQKGKQKGNQRANKNQL